MTDLTEGVQESAKVRDRVSRSNHANYIKETKTCCLQDLLKQP